VKDQGETQDTQGNPTDGDRVRSRVTHASHLRQNRSHEVKMTLKKAMAEESQTARQMCTRRNQSTQSSTQAEISSAELRERMTLSARSLQCSLIKSPGNIHRNDIGPAPRGWRRRTTFRPRARARSVKQEEARRSAGQPRLR